MAANTSQQLRVSAVKPDTIVFDFLSRRIFRVTRSIWLTNFSLFGCLMSLFCLEQPNADSHAGNVEEAHPYHESSHGHGAHQQIGYSLVFGFIFMLLVDQIGNTAWSGSESIFLMLLLLKWRNPL